VLDHVSNRVRASLTVGPVILALTVGLLSGYGAVAFRRLIRFAHTVFFDLHAGGGDASVL